MSDREQLLAELRRTSFAIAYRMLGSVSEAEDVVQEALVRVTRPSMRVLGRVRSAGLEYSADPLHRRRGELNGNDGGRGFYVRDPGGHNLEFLTRPITG